MILTLDYKYKLALIVKLITLVLLKQLKLFCCTFFFVFFTYTSVGICPRGQSYDFKIIANVMETYRIANKNESKLELM